MARSLSPECRLVFLSACAPRTDAAIGMLVRERVDWARVVAIAERENAVAVLWRCLERTSRTELSADVADRFRRSAMVSDFRMLYLSQRLQSTLVTLREHGARIMLLKGAALGASVHSSFAERPMSDVDLLVRPEDVARARAALATSGWTEFADPAYAELYAHHHHMAPFFDRDATGLRIELHTSLLPSDQPFAMSPAAIWAAGSSAGEAYAGASIPSAGHLLWHASVHFAWSHTMQFGAWRTFRDAHAILQSPTFDWDEFVRLAHQTRAASACYWTLRLAARLSGAPVPADVLSRLRAPMPEPVRRALERHFVADIAIGEGPPCPSVTLAHHLWRLAIRPRWSGHATVATRRWRDEWQRVRNGPTRREPMDRVVRHVTGARHWWRYLVRTLTPLV